MLQHNNNKKKNNKFICIAPHAWIAAQRALQQTDKAYVKSIYDNSK